MENKISINSLPPAKKVSSNVIYDARYTRTIVCDVEANFTYFVLY